MIPVLVTLVTTVCVKIDFPAKTMSNFEQERRYVHIDLIKQLKETTKPNKQMTVEGGDTSTSTVGRSAGSSPPVFNNSADDARVPENHLKTSSIQIW